MNKEPTTIAKMFNAIAPKYDTGNALLSFGLHNYWNTQLVQCAPQKLTSITHLDLCCGTGEITARYLRTAKPAHYKGYLLDFSTEMLVVAKKRLNGNDITFLEADAQEIPLPDASVDFITLAYGIRNIQNPFKCIQEAHRILKPGGAFAILELTRPQNKILRLGHAFHLKWMLPFVGNCLGNKQAYKYLQGSIEKFMDAEQLKQKILAKFKAAEIRPLTGGIATLWVAKK